MSTNGQQERRVTSFRIDDILALPHGQSRSSSSATEADEVQCAANAVVASTTPVQSLQLRFGMDQILASRESEPSSRGRVQCYGTCDQMYSPFWSPSLVSAHAPPYICSTLPHANCEACYGAASYQYLANGYTGIYEDYRSSLSKSHLAQVLPGQPKSRKPRRPWTRAVFSNLQRKGLEKRFQVQKYLTKADRHQLASMLGLTDNQVKVWFQNRRMKWRQDARESVTGTGEEESEKNP